MTAKLLKPHQIETKVFYILKITKTQFFLRKLDLKLLRDVIFLSLPGNSIFLVS